MRRIAWILGLCGLISSASAQGLNFGAELGLGEKYDDNLDLSGRGDPAEKLRAASVTEGSLGGRLTYTNDPFDLELRMKLRADVPASWGETRLYSEGEIYGSYAFDMEHSVTLLSLADCFSDYNDATYDVCREHFTLAWRWAFDDAWRLQAGLESLSADYINTEALTYSTIGLFSEIRYLYSYRLSYWARATAHLYIGAFRAQTGDVLEAPAEGFRISYDLGIDWMNGRGLSVLGGVRAEADESPKTALHTVDGTSLSDDDLETDWQFNYRKLRGTLLLSWRLSETWMVGTYAEMIGLLFVRRTLPEAELPDRRDLRYLVAAWAGLNLTQSLTLKARLSIRQNHSTVPSEAYINRIGFLGLEQRW